MPVPASYTEETLAAFLHQALGSTATVLGWSVVAGSYDHIVTQTLLDYGTDTIGDITGLSNLAKLQALAMVRLWSAVVMATAGLYDFKADGGQYNRSQIHAAAMAALQESKAQALAYDPNYQVTVGLVTYPDDPYNYRPELDEE